MLSSLKLSMGFAPSRLVAALDAPVADDPALRALLARKPAWER